MMKKRFCSRLMSACLALIMLAALALPGAAAASTSGQVEYVLYINDTLSPSSNPYQIERGATATVTLKAYTVDSEGHRQETSISGAISWSATPVGTVHVTPNTTGSTTATITASSNLTEVSSARIQASIGGTARSAECFVTVVPPAVLVNQISLNPDKLTVTVGQHPNLPTVIFEPFDASDKTITWTSSKPSVVRIEGSSFYADSIGTAVLTATSTATSSGKPVSATCEVEVKRAPVTITRITLSESNVTKTLGSEDNTFDLKVTFDPNTEQAIEDHPVNWFSYNTAVVSVESTGNDSCRVKLEGAGLTRVRASAGGQIADCTITVLPAPIYVESIKLSLDKLALNVGRSSTLEVQYTPTNASSGKNIRWSSSDEKIATVDARGKVTGVAAGTATITASAIPNDADETYDPSTNENLTATCEVTVSIPEVKVNSITLNQSAIQLDAIGAKEILVPSFSISPAGTDATDELKAVEWKSSDTAVATVDKDGNVTAVAPGEATVTVTSKLNNAATAECIVVVSGVVMTNESKKPTSSLEVMVNHAGTLLFDAYGAAAGLTAIWKSDDTTIAYVTNGRVTARAVGETVVTITAGNYSAKCNVKVTENNTGRVTGTATQGLPLSLSTLRSKINSASVASTGAQLAYVTNLTVSTAQGILYYDYVSNNNTGKGVAANAKYYYNEGVSGQLSISKVTFVPKADFFGTATITYTGYSTKNEMFNGSIDLDVKAAGDSSSGTSAVQGDVNYATTRGSNVTFHGVDFVDACQSRTNESLAYVMFSLPSSSVGRLYYNYHSDGGYDYEVGANTAYYPDGKAPELSAITFVPASSQVENATIRFTGYGNDGTRFSGTVAISFNSSSSSGGTSGINSVITYSTRMGRPVSVQSSDFDDLCRRMIGGSLDYVQFNSLPSADQGTLYYDFVNVTNYGSALTTSTRCYNNGSPLLSSVTFVPKAEYSGTVSIPFTGRDSSGYSFKGTLRIQVDTDDYVVRYSVSYIDSVPFQTRDFEELSVDATGKSLDYIQFSPPASTKGTLYYQPSNSDNKAQEQVTSTSTFYREGKKALLSDVRFTALTTYTGMVEIPFNGVSVSGEKFTGRVEIEVYIPPTDSIRYSGSSLPIQFDGEDFNQACKDALGENLRYIQFENLPNPEAGHLYYNYAGYNSSAQAVMGRTSYYYNSAPNLSNLCFVAKAGYEGLVSLNYTGMDAKGRQVTGVVSIVVSSTCVSSFSDMGRYPWASAAVEYLREYGVVNGVNETQFAPERPTLRCEFITMLCRTFGLSSNSTTSFWDVPEDSYYAGAVAVAKELGITTGTGGNMFHPEAPLSRQDAMVLLVRTMEIVGLEVSTDVYLDWSEYSDSDMIADYAFDAVGSMISMGLVKGDGTGVLNPTGEISRAEMAVILYRILAQ